MGRREESEGPEGREGVGSPSSEPAVTPVSFRLLLIRHGSTPLNEAGRYQGTRDPPLSPLGIRQARALGDRLRSEGVDVETIWTSDALRARSTARRAFPDREPTVDRRLRELDFGLLEGNTHEENLELHGDAYRRWIEVPAAGPPPGGEPLSSLTERVGAWLEDLPSEGTHAAVSHLGTIAACLHLLLSLPWKAAFGEAPGTGGAVRVERGGGEAVLLSGIAP